MKIFFDTEFTGLIQNTSLISIGLISDEGHTFYGEFDDYNKDQVDAWIQQNVIQKMTIPQRAEDEECYYIASRREGNPVGNDLYSNFDSKVRGFKSEVKSALEEWIGQFDEIDWISDVCHYDFMLLIDLLYGHGIKVPYKKIGASCHDINQDIANYFKISEREAFDLNRESILEKHGIMYNERDKHNALHDAKVIRDIYRIVNK